jgi:hypothetical protein
MSIAQRNEIEELKRRVLALEEICAALGLDKVSAMAAIDALSRKTLKLPEKNRP